MTDYNKLKELLISFGIPEISSSLYGEEDGFCCLNGSQLFTINKIISKTIDIIEKNESIVSFAFDKNGKYVQYAVTQI